MSTYGFVMIVVGFLVFVSDRHPSPTSHGAAVLTRGTWSVGLPRGRVGQMVSCRGSNAEPKDSRTVVVVGCGQHPLAACFATANAHRLRSDCVRWHGLVTEKCPNDHGRSDNGGHRAESLGTLVGERWPDR